MDSEHIYQHKRVHEHKGYDIIFYLNYAKKTKYYYIAQDGERVSILALTSPTACVNVIDTYLKSLKK